MAVEREDLFERYLRAVAKELSHVEPGRREAAVAELRTHLADAAAAEGRDPDEPAFQAAQIARLGPARHVGRELAVANGAEPPAPLWLRILGGIGVLLGPFILVAAFSTLSTRDEDFGEFLLIASQLSYVFAIPVVYAMVRPALPRLGFAHLILGLLGALPIPLGAALSAINPNPLISPLAGLILLMLPGLWVTLTGVLAMLRFTRLHSYARERDRLFGPALIGLLSGPAWIILFTSGTFGGMSEDGPALMRAITTFALYFWMVFNTLWCLAMAGGLLLPASWFADPETPVTESHRPRL